MDEINKNAVQGAVAWLCKMNRTRQHPHIIVVFAVERFRGEEARCPINVFCKEGITLILAKFWIELEAVTFQMLY